MTDAAKNANYSEQKLAGAVFVPVPPPIYIGPKKPSGGHSTARYRCQYYGNSGTRWTLQ